MSKLNPIDDVRRQDFLRSLPAVARAEVTRAFLEEIEPEEMSASDLCASVRLKAMGSGYREDRPFLSQWLVHKIDAGKPALDFAGWCLSWHELPRNEKSVHLADIAATRGALA